MAVYDISPYTTGRNRSTSSPSYPASGSGYGRSTNRPRLDYGAAAGNMARSSPLSAFPGASLFAGGIPGFGGGGGGGGTRRFRSASQGFRDPYGNAAAAQQAIAGVPRSATAEDYHAYVTGVAAGQMPSTEELGYIGGFQSDYVSRQHVGADPMWGAGNLSGDAPRNTASTVFGRPIYREGAAYSFMSRLGEAGIRQWQAFFAGLGFQTGPSGVISQHDLAAMNAFMGMANGVPGGGMKVDTLRNLVMDQVRSGVYFFRGVNEEGDLLPAMLGETPAGDLASADGAGGGGAGGEFTGPITETVTRNIVQEFSMDQGMLALRNIVANQIGRAPNDDEVREFVRQLNSAFRADPTVITQVTVTDPATGESTTDITEQETGVSAEAQAVEFGQEGVPEEELYEYQASRYFDRLMSEIGM
jgi:hypothetical protein